MSGHCGAPEKSCGSECAQRRVIKLDAGKHQAPCGEPSSVRPKLAGFWPIADHNPRVIDAGPGGG